MAVIEAPNGGGTGTGSHQPALRALARFTKIRSVVEFGSGRYSTHLFLDKRAFPDLTSLVTFECKRKWAEHVWEDDDRLTFIITPFANLVMLSKDMRADFAFVDCAPHDRRHELLEHILKIAPIVGFHDSKASDFKNCTCKYIKCFNDKIQTVFLSHATDLSGLEI